MILNRGGTGVKLTKISGRLLLLSLTLALTLVMLLTDSFAWFRSSDDQVNRFSAPERPFSVRAIDVFNPLDTVSPGQSVAKRVGAVNVSDTPAFVRLMVQPSIVSADGQPLEAIAGKQLTYVGLNTTQWVYGNDGYYYYLNVLDPQGNATATSPDLFTAVRLASDLDDTYRGATLNVVVKTEAVDTVKWHYRSSWWRSESAPSQAPLSSIDAVLAAKAK